MKIWCDFIQNKSSNLTSESLNNSGMNPSKKQPKNIATDMKVIVNPPSMSTSFFFSYHKCWLYVFIFLSSPTESGQSILMVPLDFICWIIKDVRAILSFHVAARSAALLRHRNVPPKQHPVLDTENCTEYRLLSYLEKRLFFLIKWFPPRALWFSTKGSAAQ